jgi:GNAT superfamily N-acetyltransferase
VRKAKLADIAAYVSFAQSAQAGLRARGFGQYVPAAHEQYAPSIQSQVEAGTLYAVGCRQSPLAFFTLDASPSQWWPVDAAPALYLAGMVVSGRARGQSVGSRIVMWSVEEARKQRRDYLRLDCHVENTWLRAYYEAHGFSLQRIVEQHPGYFGCLYELAVARRR